MGKIFDLKKEEQTDSIKTRLYNLTRQFVYKYWREYYSSFKGDLDDLVSDFYVDFCTAKSREEGNEQSLLDKFDPNITTLEYLVKVAVQRKLVDKARGDKHEMNYAERYDEETGDLSLDFLAKHIDEEDESVDKMVFTEDDIFELRDKFDALSEEEKKHFVRVYNEVKNVLAPNFQALFEDLVSGYKPKQKAVSGDPEEQEFISKFGEGVRFKKKGQLEGATFSTGTAKKGKYTFEEMKEWFGSSENWKIEPVGNSKVNVQISKK